MPPEAGQDEIGDEAIDDENNKQDRCEAPGPGASSLQWSFINLNVVHHAPFSPNSFMEVSAF
jgi:hypothetical protein